jgi:putative phage-type endonuclease
MSNLSFTQEQRTLEWYRARLGYITGSQVGSLMKSGRTKDKVFSDTALTYLYQLAGERSLNPEIVKDDNMFTFYLEQTTSQSKNMRFGTEQEENARAMYVDITGREVKEVGLCHHPQIKYLASSPDGITADGDVMGCVEIKCPTLSTYSKYVAEIHDNESLKKVNPDYYYQCQNHMACTEAQFCDFIVYCPFVENPIHIVRVQRDEDAIALIMERVELAEQIIEENYSQLKRA